MVICPKRSSFLGHTHSSQPRSHYYHIITTHSLTRSLAHSHSSHTHLFTLQSYLYHTKQGSYHLHSFIHSLTPGPRNSATIYPTPSLTHSLTHSCTPSSPPSSPSSSYWQWWRARGCCCGDSCWRLTH